MTGDELEALQLDATANGQPGWSSSGDGHDETGQSNATGTSPSAGGYDWTYLAFLTAFASTGYVQTVGLAVALFIYRFDAYK